MLGLHAWHEWDNYFWEKDLKATIEQLYVRRLDSVKMFLLAIFVGIEGLSLSVNESKALAEQNIHIAKLPQENEN